MTGMTQRWSTATVINRIELDQVAEHLPELIEEVQHGAEIVLTKDDQPIARLVRYSQPMERRQPGSAKGLITLADDWDAPLEDFEEYTR